MKLFKSYYASVRTKQITSIGRVIKCVAHKLGQVPPGYLIIGIDPHKKIHVAVVIRL